MNALPHGRYRSITYMDADHEVKGPFREFVGNASRMFDPAYENVDIPKNTTICAIFHAEHDVDEKGYSSLKEYQRNFCVDPYNKMMNHGGSCLDLTTATDRANFVWEYPDNNGPMLQANYMFIDLECLPSPEVHGCTALVRTA